MNRELSNKIVCKLRSFPHTLRMSWVVLIVLDDSYVLMSCSQTAHNPRKLQVVNDKHISSVIALQFDRRLSSQMFSQLELPLNLNCFTMQMITSMLVGGKHVV